ncbi:hepatitis A virus cellular receptor 1-like isoform X1, partial [Sigmodon hispidus]
PSTFSPDQTTAEVTETPSHTLADWVYSVTSSEDSWKNYTGDITSWKPENGSSDFHIGISIYVLLLLMLLLLIVWASVITRYILIKEVMDQRVISLNIS